MRRGIVVGKFCPFHRGHQLLVESALAQTDRLTVVVYDVFIDDNVERTMPAQKRAKWITDLYPGLFDVVVVEDTLAGDYDSHDGPEYSQHYADQLSFLGDFTHVFSSEDYGIPFAQALKAEHVTVDAARDLMPISGTIVRSDLHKYRAYVDPMVYSSLIRKVVFVGTESSGKSTLTKAMAEALDTNYTLEYGRTLWEYMHGLQAKTSFHDLWSIGKTQYKQEQAAVKHSNRFLFCDTNAWTTMMWSQEMYGNVDSRLRHLAESTIDEYTWVLCANDFGWVDDGMREMKDGKAERFQMETVRKLSSYGIPYSYVDGDVEQRVRAVQSLLGVSPVEAR